jgi:GNAT superfamily N-acetyltransferase
LTISDVIETTLRDGGRAMFRPLLPEDRWRLQEGFSRLSANARYFRFGRHVDQLRDEEWDQLIAVDGVDHLAWVGIDPDRPDEPGLGVARCIREPYDRHAAEAAITVAEGQRGRGVGTILLGVLANQALAVGITEFRNYVVAENASMIGVFEALGGRITTEGRIVRVDLPLRDDPDAAHDGRRPPDGPAARVFRAFAARANQ